MHKQEVTYSLPTGASWYNFYNKKAIASNVKDDNEWVTVTLSDLEQAVFVRAGSILPILLHADCMSLLSCYENDISLEVYLGEARNATGVLYIDDGSSYDYDSSEDKRAYLTYSVDAGVLITTSEQGSLPYNAAPAVASVAIYG